MTFGSHRSLRQNSYLSLLSLVCWFFFFVCAMEGARTGRRRIAPQAISPVQQRRPQPAAETGRSCWGRVLIFQGFSGYSTKIAPPFNHKNGGTLSTHGRGKCGIYNAQKVFGLIILHLRIDVHSCLAVFMPRKILNCLWINASIQKIGNVGMP